MLKFDNLIKTILESPDSIKVLDANGQKTSVSFKDFNDRSNSFILFDNHRDKYIIFKDSYANGIGHDRLLLSLRKHEYEKFYTNMSHEELDLVGNNVGYTSYGRIWRNHKIVSFWKDYQGWWTDPMNLIFRRLLGVRRPKDYIFEVRGRSFIPELRTPQNSAYVYTYDEFMSGNKKHDTSDEPSSDFD